MKIENVGNIVFRAQTLDNYILEAKEKTGTRDSVDYSQNNIPQDVYKQKLFQLNQKPNSYKIDAPEINPEKITLDNNAVLLLDISPDSEKAIGTLQLDLQKKSNSTDATYLILSKMLAMPAEKLCEANDYKVLHDVDCNGNSINGDVTAVPDKFLESFEKQLEIMFNPDLSEENFEAAKKTECESVKLNSEYKRSEALRTLYRNKNITVEDFESVTLDDVKTLYNRLINNSELKIVMSMPENLYKEQKENIINLIQTKVPLVKKAEYKPIKYIEPLVCNSIFKRKTDTYPSIVRLYNYNDDNSIRSNVELQILSKVINNRIKADKMDNCVKFNYLDSLYNKYIEFCLDSEKADKSIDELESYLNVLIKSLTENPIKSIEVEQAKKEICKEKEDDYKNYFSRAWDISYYNYTDGIISISKIEDAINKITEKDIQQLIDTSLNKYYSEELLY